MNEYHNLISLKCELLLTDCNHFVIQLTTYFLFFHPFDMIIELYIRSLHSKPLIVRQVADINKKRLLINGPSQ